MGVEYARHYCFCAMVFEPLGTASRDEILGRTRNVRNLFFASLDSRYVTLRACFSSIHLAAILDLCYQQLDLGELIC